MRPSRQQQDDKTKQRKRSILLIVSGFVLGFVVSSAAILNAQHLLDRLDYVGTNSSKNSKSFDHLSSRRAQAIDFINKDIQSFRGGTLMRPGDSENASQPKTANINTESVPNDASIQSTSKSSSKSSTLQDIKILVAIAAFDFSQIPHLEEVLDSYHDICVAGAKVDVVIHATVAYPVTFIDMLNSRFLCEDFSIHIMLKPSSIRLHLVDYHRKLFYDKINDYDLFIYTEEDIQITPRTVATYLQETQRIRTILANNPSSKYSFFDFNVGIVRYEYNFPSNVVIDDKTRHSIQNVTRVYWEHSSQTPSLVPNTLDSIPQTKELSERYVGMKNHHQGMFLATREHLLAWKDRPKCNFDVVKNRPGTRSQPSEGTQRVWMSSHQLFGKRHCNVQQVLPKDKFGALTVLHVPNKNYRRVGKYRNRKFSDGTEVFEQAPNLLTALQLHLAMRKQWPATPQIPYKGAIKMIDEVTDTRTTNLDRRMQEFNDYVSRGGVLSEHDFTRTVLVEDS